MQALLAKQIDSEGGMTPAALATLSRLTLKQIQGMTAAAAFVRGRRGAPVNSRGQLFYYSRRAYPLVRFCGMLSETQKRRALSSEGLHLEQMNLAQQQTFLYLAVRHNGRKAMKDLAAARLRIMSGRPRRPEEPGEPWVAFMHVSCIEQGHVSPVAVSYPAPGEVEDKRRDRAGGRRRRTGDG